MDKELKEKLIFLADKYENPNFLEKDPSRFMHDFSDSLEQEIVAFIAANLSFGRREQILLHIEMILNDFKTKNLLPSEWILSENYKNFFAQENKSFYRMFTHNDMILFFDGIKKILEEDKTLGNHVKKRIEQFDLQNFQFDKESELFPEQNLQFSNKTERFSNKSGHFGEQNLQFDKKSQKIFPCKIIALDFDLKCKIIPHTMQSADKRINMFLRWMVRKNSPVDLGLWNSWFSQKNLLMPLDTHVMQQATNLGLILPSKSGKILNASLKTAISLTEKLKEVFPDDPVKADFALFGYGVNS